jgi:hypothetical protein
MRRFSLVLAAGAVLAAVAAPSPVASASCVASVQWQGGLYIGLLIDGDKPLRLGSKLRGAVVPDCNDTGGPPGAPEPVNIRHVRDVPTRLVVARPDQATPTHRFVYVRGATYWQAVNHPLRLALAPKGLARRFVARSGCRTTSFRAAYRKALVFGAARISVRANGGTRTVRLEPPTRLGRPWLKRPFRRGDDLRIRGRRCDGGVLVAHSITRP